MDIAKIIATAKSFPEEYEEFEVFIDLTLTEFSTFEEGIFAKDMDSKWHIFVTDNNLYWVRSWTGFCIYKIPYNKNENHVELRKVLVSRNKDEYTSTNLEHDKITFLKLLQAYLNRNDLYIDPRFQLKLIIETISKYDPQNNYEKSIGDMNVGIARQVFENNNRILGWDDLKEKISDKDSTYDLLSLNIHDNSGITFYFDKDANELIGKLQFIIK